MKNPQFSVADKEKIKKLFIGLVKKYNCIVGHRLYVIGLINRVIKKQLNVDHTKFIVSVSYEEDLEIAADKFLELL
jgi:hypothetical protein